MSRANPLRRISGSAAAIALATPEARFAPPDGPQPNVGQRGWLHTTLVSMLARRTSAAWSWVACVQRLLRLTELNELVATVEASGRTDQFAALSEAMQLTYRFEGLENFKSVGERPVVLFANHPTGGGNVLGMCLLLASQFSDYRILGNQHMKFLRSLSQKMIPVDPFCSTATINLNSLLNLRQDFGMRYQALGVFPAGISSRLQIDGTIADRRWSDAFIRIANRHNALLVPVWFSGRNRLRYYLAARIRAELGFLALPAEFLRLRGQSITVRIGKPIDPAMLGAIENRDAQMSFLRAGVYSLGRRKGSRKGLFQRSPTSRPHLFRLGVGGQNG
jgi:putative hemolysin